MEEEEEVLENSEEEIKPKGKETKEPERDVYTFPGDSDQESPPPAPWAHCTFIQRCRKKRVLLRPFSGLGTFKRTLPETAKLARPSLQKSETVQLNRGGEVYDFEEVSFGEGGVEPIKFRDRGGRRDKEGEEESGVESDKEIFTCVECSIYFKKQVHLQEHMIEHNQSGAGGGRRLGKGSRFQCVECGWNLQNRLALADHHRRHQESRLKILEEIEKLNENGKAKEFQTLDSKVLSRSVDPAVTESTGPAATLSKVSDQEIVKCPPVSPVSAPDPEPGVLDLDAAPPNSVRTPTQTRALSAYHRRRFVCTKCNFSTRTSQALANHSKTHNRKKPTLQPESSSLGSPSSLASTSLSCGHCGFLTSSESILREHRALVHPGQIDESGQRLKANVGGRILKPNLDPEVVSESGSKRAVADSDDSRTADGAAARPARQVVFNRRFSRRGKTWTDLAKLETTINDEKLPESEEEEQDQDRRTEFNTELSQEEESSAVGVRPQTRVRSNMGETKVKNKDLIIGFDLLIC